MDPSIDWMPASGYIFITNWIIESSPLLKVLMSDIQNIKSEFTSPIFQYTIYISDSFLAENNKFPFQKMNVCKLQQTRLNAQI